MARTRWWRRSWRSLGYKLERAKTNIGHGPHRSHAAADSGEGHWSTHDKHTTPFRACRQFPRRLRHFRDSQQGQDTTPDALPKLQRFLQIAVEFKPVNLGDARQRRSAAALAESMNPLAHWNRDMTPDFEAVIDGLDKPTTVAAVFDNAWRRKISSSGEGRGPGAEHQHLHFDRRRGTVLQSCLHSAPQRGLFAGL